MRYYLLIVLLLPTFLLAQSPLKLSVETRSGYEYNAFNGHKNKTVLDADGESIASIQSGFYQRWGVRASWKKKLKSHKLGFTAKANKDEYWTLKSANLFRSDYQFSYSYQLQKTASVYYKTQFSTYKTNRISNATEVIAIPSAYKKLDANLGYKFRPHKKNKTQIEISALQKSYQPNEDRQLSYFSYGLELNSTQRFKKRGKPSSYLNLSISLNQRNYRESPTEDFWDLEEWEDTEIAIDSLTEYRIWGYQTFEIGYTYKINKPLKIKGGLSFQQRLDRLEERFGFQQWQPSVALDWKKDKLKLQWKISYAFRNFTDLKADENGLFTLRHQYLRSYFLATYSLNDNWVLSGKFNLRKRWRNQPIGATNNYLPYLTGVISIGIKYQF